MEERSWSTSRSRREKKLGWWRARPEARRRVRAECSLRVCVECSLCVRVHELGHQGLLQVQPVCGLLEDDASRTVENGIGDLLAAMGGEAVHEDRVGYRQSEERLVDLEAGERHPPPGGLSFLPHARPGIRIDHVRPFDRFARIPHAPYASGR